MCVVVKRRERKSLRLIDTHKDMSERVRKKQQRLEGRKRERAETTRGCISLVFELVLLCSQFLMDTNFEACET